jgi:lipopolysaccharide export system protein LptA
MTLGRPLHFDYQQGLLTSRGTVAVRGDQLQFEGSDMTVEINSANKTLEDLQIAHGRKLILSGLFHKPQASTPTTLKTNTYNPAGGTATVANKASVRGPAHTPAPASPAKLTTYAMTFARHVHVALGAQTMSANRLQLYFQTAAKAPNAAGANSPATGENTPRPTKSGAPATPPAPASPVMNHAKNPPLVIHWTGPLVLRPTRHPPVTLTGSRDVYLRANGQKAYAVVMHDGPTRTAQAAEVTYQTAQQVLTMLPAPHVPVTLVDPSMGKMTCEKLVYNNLTHHADFSGPGSFAMTGASAGKNPWHGSWQSNLSVQLASTAATAGATTPAIGQGKLAVRHIRMTGRAALHNAQTSLEAESFIARFVQTTGPSAASALSYFSADKHVVISSGNPGLPAADNNSLACGHLVLLTSRNNSHENPIPYQLQAQHKVQLTFFQKPSAGQHAVEQFTISGGNLRTQLIARATKPKAKSDGTGDLGGRYTVGRFRIWKHTIVHIYNIGRPITATADQLSGNRADGTATLQGDPTGNTEAVISQGADWLKGKTIDLQRQLQQVTVPGPGELSMPESSKAAQPRVTVSWKTHMQYSARTRQAMLNGQVVAQLAGQADQHSSLAAPAMLIHFQRRKTDRKALKLAQLIASGPATSNTVIARDASYNKAGVLQTRMRLQCLKLEYNAIAGVLKIPASGQMVVEDYRPATASNAQQRGQSAFAWTQSLDYKARTGIVNLRGRVRLVFRPVKPLPVPTSTSGKKNPNAGLVLLRATELLVQLSHTGPAAKNGVDLGMGGPTRLKNVTANNAALQVSGLKLAAEMLKFNATKELAQAYGFNGQPAIISDVSGNIHGQARHIIWNLSKGKNGFTLIEPTGSANLP